MNQSLKFSIVIPTYNRGHLILDVLESCLNQSYENFEVLIIDDGGKDNTKEVIAKVIERDSRINYFYKENGERGAARNFGSQNASGEYVLFIDSDDRMEPNCLLNYAKAIKEHKPKVLFAKYRFFDGNKYSDSDISALKAGWYDWTMFLKGNYFASMICFRKNEDEIKVPESREYTTSEDWVFNILKTYKSKFYFIEEMAYTMLIHDARSMNQNQDFIIKTKINARNLILKNTELNKSHKAILDSHVNYFCAIHSYVGLDRKSGFKYLSKIGPEVSLVKRIKLLIKILIGRKILLNFRR